MSSLNNSSRSAKQAQAETSQENLTRRLLQQMAGDRNTITLHKFIIDVCDGDHLKALLVEQLMYWSERSRSADGEVAKSDADWHDELRLSPRQMRRIRDWLKKSKVADVARKRSPYYSGQPVYHYALNWKVLQAQVKAKLTAELDEPVSSELPKNASSEVNEPASSERDKALTSERDQPASSFTEPTPEPTTKHTEYAPDANAPVPRTPPEKLADKPKRKKSKANPRSAELEPDIIYETVETHIFGIEGTPDMPYQWSGRCGQITSWLKGAVASVDGQEVGKISRPAAPEHIKAFARAWVKEHTGAPLPRKPDRFVEHWRAWASKQAGARPRANLQEATPEDKAALVREYVA